MFASILYSVSEVSDKRWCKKQYNVINSYLFRETHSR
jgi:hypothetical protein